MSIITLKFIKIATCIYEHTNLRKIHVIKPISSDTGKMIPYHI